MCKLDNFLKNLSNLLQYVLSIYILNLLSLKEKSDSNIPVNDKTQNCNQVV